MTAELHLPKSTPPFTDVNVTDNNSSGAAVTAEGQLVQSVSTEPVENPSTSASMSTSTSTAKQPLLVTTAAEAEEEEESPAEPSSQATAVKELSTISSPTSSSAPASPPSEGPEEQQEQEQEHCTGTTTTTTAAVAASPPASVAASVAATAAAAAAKTTSPTFPTPPTSPTNSTRELHACLSNPENKTKTRARPAKHKVSFSLEEIDVDDSIHVRSDTHGRGARSTSPPAATTTTSSSPTTTTTAAAAAAAAAVVVPPSPLVATPNNKNGWLLKQTTSTESDSSRMVNTVDVDDIMEQSHWTSEPESIPPLQQMQQQQEEDIDNSDDSDVDFDSVLKDAPPAALAFAPTSFASSTTTSSSSLASTPSQPTTLITTKAVQEKMDQQQQQQNRPLLKVTKTTSFHADDVSLGESSMAASVASVPQTQQAYRRASQRVLRAAAADDDPNTTATTSTVTDDSNINNNKRPSLEQGQKSNSFKVYRMWQGMKKTMNVVGIVKTNKNKDNNNNNKSNVRNSSASVPEPPKDHSPTFQRFNSSPVRNRMGRFAASLTGSGGSGNPSTSSQTREEARAQSLQDGKGVSSSSASGGSTGGGGVFGIRRDKRMAQQPITPERLKELEAIGKALKEGLAYSTMQDRQKKTTFEKCFSGSAAVDFLSHYTNKSRPEALAIGRELVEHFGLFVNLGATKFHSHDGSSRSSIKAPGSSSTSSNTRSSIVLQDSRSTFYRMVAYLPMEVKKMNMMTKVRLFEEGVKVKTRRQGLRKHKKCFVGSEAVQFLVRSRIVKTRLEAVELGRNFIRQFNLFEPVLRDHTFEDSKHKLYRFVDKRFRYFSIDNMLSTRLVAMGGDDTDLSGNGDDDDDKDDDGVSSVGGSSFVSRSTKADSVELNDVAQQGSDEGGDPRVYQRLMEVAEILERGIKVSDNTKRVSPKKGVSYVDTFVAARAVTFMVTSGLAESRAEAAKLGRRLEREFNLFTEVTGKHDFSDSNFYFRFTDKKERFTKPVKAELPLKEVAAKFEQGVVVKDHMYRLMTYKKTFMGSKAVDFLVNTRLATSRSHAVRIGCQLVEKYNLFERVTGNREFADDQVYFRFTPLDQRMVPEEDLPQHKRRRRSGRTLLLDRIVASTSSVGPKQISEEMLAIAESFLNGVKVKEHKFRAKSFRGTFVGSEAVSFMVNSSLAKSRKEAVELGKKLTEEVGLFLGIDDTKDFKDDYLLYRFSQQFEETTKATSADKTPLRGLVSTVSGLNMNNVNLKSLPLEKIAEAFRNGVKVGDGSENPEKRRSYDHMIEKSGDLLHFSGEILKHTGEVLKPLMKDKKKKAAKRPDDAFLGCDAVDFLVGSGLADSRVEAVDLGRTIAREFNLFEHCDQEHELEDEEFYYRFCYDGPVRPLEMIRMDISRLMTIAKDFETCVKLKENKIRLRTYKNTFLGCEAVDYLVDSCIASTRKEAVQIGRAITKEFNLFEHVTNDRKFEDSPIPYFFVNDSQRYKGLNLEKKRARRNIFACSDEDDSDSSEEDMRSSVGSQSLRENFSFAVQAEDTEWANKLSMFERRMHQTQSYVGNSTRQLVMVDDDSSQSSSEIRKDTMQKRFKEWASKFHRLDPRYQIRYFFDFVAQDGAENAETNVMDVDNLRPLYNFLPSRAQVFTVWRPTSADAIRKMMLGEAVGKGLDIKGKSAKRGKLSGFVPFLQIGENKHKSKIRPPSKEGVVRVFYPGEARRGRDIAAEKLERIGLEMIETVKGAKEVLADNTASKSARKDALEAMLLDMGPDPSITYIDDYAPKRYGLEIPERLFWEAYFVRQDCTRKPGSEYDTGRPSQPAFQDMNFAAIRAEPKEGAPRAVVYQSADADSPMNPFEMLVAYEEAGRVMPVVSDFDCFLVGTKRVNFTSPLAPNQLNVLKWYVGEIENLMKSSKVGDSFTVKWLEILKKAAREGFYPEMPRFGFGDPKSYSIMKNAVSRLGHSGAVRHGAECFNYYFPQDLDDEFLVIASDLPNGKPWAYVDVEGLQNILEEKIEQGFTFPLNPKWVLCDSFRWKELYDKLLKSDKEETQQSMNVWFPPESGLRELIERVHQARPCGFYKGAENDDDDNSSSEMSDGGATGAKDLMMSTVVAIRLLEKFQERTKKYQTNGENSDEDSVTESRNATQPTS